MCTVNLKNIAKVWVMVFALLKKLDSNYGCKDGFCLDMGYRDGVKFRHGM